MFGKRFIRVAVKAVLVVLSGALTLLAVGWSSESNESTWTTQRPNTAVNPPTEAASKPNSTGLGYWLVASDGGVFSFGDAGFHGSAGDIIFNQSIAAMTATLSGDGYWLVSSNGGIFAFGNAMFFNPTDVIPNQPIVGIAHTLSGLGYWLVASDGGVFSFGDAQFYGSTGNMVLNQPIVGMASTPSGNGYWLVASDGGVFSFGDAAFHGSTGNIALNQPIVGMAATSSGNGYWLAAADGGIFSFGDAFFYGSMGGTPLNQPVVGMATTPSGNGYWLVASDGGVFSFGDAQFYGSTGNMVLNQPIVGMASTPSGSGYWDKGKLVLMNNGGDVWLINSDGSGKIHLTSSADGPWAGVSSSLPAWSPRGDKLAVRMDGYRLGDHHWLVFSRAGNVLEKIAETQSPTGVWSPKEMSWSPDNTSLIYGLYDDGIYELNLVTQATRQILTTTGFTYDHSPVWSPDGKKIVFVHHEFGGRFYVSLIDFDETEIPYRGEDRNNRRFNPKLALLVAGRCPWHDQPFRFQWTPDSRKVVFSSGSETDPWVGTIYVVNVVTGEVVKIQPEGFGQLSIPDHVDLSNDGRQIAFAAGSDLFVVGIDGSNLRRIFSGGDSWLYGLDYPRWSPTNSQIAFTSFVSGVGQSVWAVNADGTGLRRLPNTDEAEAIEWSPRP